MIAGVCARDYNDGVSAMGKGKAIKQSKGENAEKK